MTLDSSILAVIIVFLSKSAKSTQCQRLPLQSMLSISTGRVPSPNKNTRVGFHGPKINILIYYHTNEVKL